MPKFLSTLNINQNQLEYPLIHISASAPVVLTATAGQMYYNSTSNKMFYHDGTSWQEFGTGGGSVTAVTGTEGIASTGGNTPALSLDFSAGLTTAALATADILAFHDFTDSTHKKMTAGALVTYLQNATDGVDHDLIKNFVGDEHINHSTLDIITSATSGLSGGGNLLTDVTLLTDNTRLTAHGGTLNATDSLSIYENAVGQRKMALSVFEAGLTILESQISDGTLLARVADNETITGSYTFNNVIIASAAPTLGTHLTNKTYVDSVASGMDVKDSVTVGTTAVLPTVTAAGSGVGKTLTASSVGILTIDGVATVAGDRILVKNQVAGVDNGIYEVTTEGTAGVAFILTRATDADEAAEVTAGMFTFVTEGTVNADSGWILTTNDPITVDTTALVFAQFSGAGQVIAGTGLTKTGNTLHIGSGTVETRSGIAFSADDLALSLKANGGLVFETNSLAVNLGATNITGVLARADIATGTANHVVINSGTGALSSEAVLDESRGGTGNGTYAIGDILYASTTAILSRLADIATGNVLISGGVSTAPSYGKVGLTTHVSGILGVANGGTAINGATAANGTLLIGNGSGYTLAALASTNSSIVITNTAGSIVIETIQATTAQIGGVIRATQAEVNTGTETTKYVTPDTLRGTDGAGNYARKYAANVGSGTTTVTVTHSLATNDVTVAVYEISTEEQVFCDVDYKSANTAAIDLIFAVAPTAAQYRVVVTG